MLGGDAFTSAPTTIFQLDFVTFSTILHSLVGFFREVFSIRVSLQTMDNVIRMVLILMRIIKTYHEISFAFFVFVLINVFY